MVYIYICIRASFLYRDVGVCNQADKNFNILLAMRALCFLNLEIRFGYILI